MPSGRNLLLCGALLTAVLSVLHIAIIVGGPALYRFFGAGDRMARLAARGSPIPAVMTSGIACAIAISSAYAVSGAGLIPQLPLLRPVLVLSAVVFLIRGVGGIPVVLLVGGPYARELPSRPTFMAVTSLVSGAIGACYALGVDQLGRAAAVR